MCKVKLLKIRRKKIFSLAFNFFGGTDILKISKSQLRKATEHFNATFPMSGKQFS
jgi:hypothetical protein